MDRIPLILLLIMLPTMVRTQVPWPDDRAEQRATELLEQMTLDEKMRMVRGHKWFFTQPIPRLGIPPLYMTDATQGVHIRRYLSDDYIEQPDVTTAFPSPIALAATWNPAMAYQYARAIGEECRAHGIHVLLGPGFNLYRQAQNGRNWEYFGEDPYLVSRLIERYVEGVHSTGTMATLKHFIANNTEYYRKRSNSVVSERALHEIYMPGYEAGIGAGARAVMTSYNLVNGEWAGQSAFVIDTLLRRRLEYDWLVMTDWISVWDAERIVWSGQDLEMPMGWQLKDLPNLIDEGTVDAARLDSMVFRILKSFASFGFYDDYAPRPAWSDRLGAHIETARETARQGTVLLKNTGVLPVDTAAGVDVLLTGRWVGKNPFGSGAGFVKGFNTVSLRDALSKRFGSDLRVKRRASARRIRSADVVLLSVGTREGEDWDRAFALPDRQESYIRRVCSLNPRTVVIVNAGSGIRMTDWVDEAAAVIWGWYPGQVGQEAMAEIITGITNPSGRLPITIERSFADGVDPDYLPADARLYRGYRLSLDQGRHPIYDVTYDEGAFTGYRWYESRDIEPLFAFGHGLSYASFRYEDIGTDRSIYTAGDTVYVSFTVTNTGERAGFETPQLYVSDPLSSVDRPIKELKGFTKRWIEPGETQTVVRSLVPRDFCYWSEDHDDWVLETGSFVLMVGASSDDIRLQRTIQLK